MAADNTIRDAIQESAAGPKSAGADGVNVSQHSLTEQIEADRYIAAKNAVTTKGRGIYWGKLKPGGCE